MAQLTTAGNALQIGAVVESMRFTAFTEPSAAFDHSAWLPNLTGAQPDERNAKPGRGEFQESGSFEGQALILAIQPGRIDWYLTPPAMAEAPGDIRSAGPFPDAFTLFLGPMLRWLPTAPPLVRLAFGAVVLIPVESKEEGYRRVSALLDTVRIDPVGSEDFLYQINRPRRSVSVEGIRVNRLSKWSVALFQRLRFGIPPVSGSTISYTGERVHACRIEVDLSTQGDHPGILPGQHLGDFLRELVNLGSEIVTRGDIA
jgi:hypothetical protein